MSETERVSESADVSESERDSGTVGYIGLGDMGAAMSETIAATYDLVVFDIREAAIEKLTEKGARPAPSATALAAQCDHIGICVPDDTAVMEVISGTDGILASCRPGTSIAVHSTVHPDTIRDLHALAAEREVVLFDAGVAGGSWTAREGGLVVMLGVPDDGIPDLARAVIDKCASAVLEGGGIGAGMAMKVAFNVMTYLQQAALSASYQIVVGEGSDPDMLLEAWRHVGQLGTLTERFYPLVAMPADAKSGPLGSYLVRTIGIAERDLNLAVNLGLESGRRMPVVEAVRDEMRLVYGMPKSDDTATSDKTRSATAASDRATSDKATSDRATSDKAN